MNEQKGFSWDSTASIVLSKSWYNTNYCIRLWNKIQSVISTVPIPCESNRKRKSERVVAITFHTTLKVSLLVTTLSYTEVIISKRQINSSSFIFLIDNLMKFLVPNRLRENMDLNFLTLLFVHIVQQQSQRNLFVWSIQNVNHFVHQLELL